MALHRNTMGDFGQVADTIDGGGWMEMLEQILRLRQASIDPNLAITSFRSKYDTNAWKLMKNRSTKIHKFIETIKEVEGYSLVFCHFRKEMELVKCELTKEGIDSEFSSPLGYTSSWHSKRFVRFIAQVCGVEGA